VDVIDNKIVHVTNRRASVSKVARDFETYTGEKSQERKLKELCTPLLQKSTSWEELHKKLAEHQITLNQKGSGGVLVIDNIEVKLSRIDRQSTWLRLTARLGEFSPAEPSLSSVAIDTKQPTVSPILNLPSWDNYVTARQKFYADKIAKTKALTILKLKQTNELKSLANEQKLIRATLNQTPMTGLKKNMERKLLSFSQAQEREQLRHTQKNESEAFRVKWAKIGVSPFFPCFKDWLAEFGEDGEADQWRFRRRQGMVGPADDNADETLSDEALNTISRAMGILHYRPIVPKVAGNNAIYYVHTSDVINPISAFADFGRHIKIFVETDEIILASLQLGLAKWGKIEVTGDDDFKKKCFEIAKNNGIKLHNKAFQDKKIPKALPLGDHLESLDKVPLKQSKSNKAYMAHIKNIKKQLKTCDQSRIDSMAALRMRVTGFTPNEIEVALKELSEHTHAKRTVAFAFSAAGDMEMNKLAHLKEEWIKLEQRHGHAPSKLRLK
ncbi:MAG: LPD7 domain-containing protein, partial [Candidatus Adiutrix sp.]